MKIDIGHDRRGKFFDLEVRENADLQVLDLQPKDRHLLLMVRREAERAGLPLAKEKFHYRQGGTTVYVSARYPNGLTAAERKSLFEMNPHAKTWNWQVMQRSPTVFVCGKVSHLDHATIQRNGWHRVVMNTENQSRAMASVAFLD